MRIVLSIYASHFYTSVHGLAVTAGSECHSEVPRDLYELVADTISYFAKEHFFSCPYFAAVLMGSLAN